jgi:tetratricopeptide (TPR) repeat protein
MMRNSLYAFTSLACLCLWLSPAAEARQSLAGNFLASQNALSSRDTEAAADYLQKALKLDPSNPAIIERLFLTQLSNGRLGDAEKTAADVIEFNSQHRMARLVLGMKEFSARRYDEARTHFSEASYTPVGELTSVLLTAWTYAGEGSLNAAMSTLDKLDSNDSFVNFKSFHAALIADFLQSSIRAEAAYKKAYQDAGSSLRVTQAYANFLRRNNRAEEAKKIYQEFLSGGEGNALIEQALTETMSNTIPAPFIGTPQAGAGEALFSLSAAMNDDQSIDVALIYSQLALAHSNDRPVMLTMLGDVLSTAQRYETANNAYGKIDAASPLRPHAETEIALNLQRTDKREEGITLMKDLLKRDPKSYIGWVTLGNLYRNGEKYADASAAYDEAVKLIPKIERKHWTLLYFRGISFERQKKWPQAEADFRKALELVPEEASVLNYLGYSLIDTNQKLDEAIAMVKKAVELRPNDGYIVDSLGWAYFQLRDFDEAVVHLERAVDLKAGDPIIAEHLGDAYWRVGRKLEASFQWQHAKDNKPEPADLVRIEDKIKNGMPPLEPLPKPATNGEPAGSNNG